MHETPGQDNMQDNSSKSSDSKLKRESVAAQVTPRCAVWPFPNEVAPHGSPAQSFACERCPASAGAGPCWRAPRSSAGAMVLVGVGPKPAGSLWGYSSSPRLRVCCGAGEHGTCPICGRQLPPDPTLTFVAFSKESSEPCAGTARKFVRCLKKKINEKDNYNPKSLFFAFFFFFFQSTFRFLKA